MGVLILRQKKFKFAKTIAEKRKGKFKSEICGKEFKAGDQIISKIGRKRKYYHKECYFKLWR